MTYKCGPIYEGSFVQGKQYGRGKLTYKDGSFYDGNWKDGARNGFGKQVDLNGCPLGLNNFDSWLGGKVITYGEYKDGDRHGYCELTAEGDTPSKFKITDIKSYKGYFKEEFGPFNWTVDDAIDDAVEIYKGYKENQLHKCYCDEIDAVLEKKGFQKNLLEEYIKAKDVYEAAYKKKNPRQEYQNRYEMWEHQEMMKAISKVSDTWKEKKTILTFFDGSYFEGEFFEGWLTRGKMTYSNGDIVEGDDFEDDVILDKIQRIAQEK